MSAAALSSGACVFSAVCAALKHTLLTSAGSIESASPRQQASGGCVMSGASDIHFKATRTLAGVASAFQTACKAQHGGCHTSLGWFVAHLLFAARLAAQALQGFQQGCSDNGRLHRRAGANIGHQILPWGHHRFHAGLRVLPEGFGGPGVSRPLLPGICQRLHPIHISLVPV